MCKTCLVLSLAVLDFPVAFLGQAKSALKRFKDEKFNCVFIAFIQPSGPIQPA